MTPLSPLRSSTQNSRYAVAKHHQTDNMDETDSDYHQENQHSSPSKRIIESSSPAPVPPRMHSYDDEDDDEGDNYDGDEGDYDEDDVVQASSPFQNNGRDDTVDFQRLMAMQREQASAGANAGAGAGSTPGTPGTPKTSGRKRSLDYMPEERSKRVASSGGGGPEINVYVDGASDAGDVSGTGTISGHSMLEKWNEGMSTVMHENEDEDEGNEDTHLSTFSAVPNTDMTSFAKLCPSPAKLSPSKSPRRNLIDLGTPQSVHGPRGTPMRQRLERRENALRQSLRIARESPSKTLLDFDLPPPTPRSIPTVTPRELETLKSGFMSEISSLRATLSGREAEVGSLKQAVADAERRVGEAMEEVRNEAARREALEVERTEWQRRGEEMDALVQEVRADIVENEREKAQLVSRVEELESAAASSTSGASGNTGGGASGAEVQEAVEKVARELHVLYKSKHETKVAALKKSYESRWEKRVREAEKRASAAASAAAAKCTNCDGQDRGQEHDRIQAEKVLEAQIQGLQQEITTLRSEQTKLATELQVERTEKGDLVAAVDEWLAVQVQETSAMDGDGHGSLSRGSTDGQSQNQSQRTQSTPEVEPEVEPEPAEEPRSEVKRPREIPKRKSGIAVLGRSGIMGSIERMGRNQ